MAGNNHGKRYAKYKQGLMNAFLAPSNICTHAISFKILCCPQTDIFPYRIPHMMTPGQHVVIGLKTGSQSVR